MPTPPPRKPFQFHLSTAIVMMFVAGALIWANVIARPEGKYIGNIGLFVEPYFLKGTEAEFLAMPHANNSEYWEGNRTLIHGWPCTGITMHKPFYREIGGFMFYPKILTTDPGIYGMDDIVIDKIAVAINVIFTVIVLAAVWYFCEYLIRRRSARKSP